MVGKGCQALPFLTRGTGQGKLICSNMIIYLAILLNIEHKGCTGGEALPLNPGNEGEAR